MKTGYTVRAHHLILATLLLAGCSRSQKSGTSISSQDVARAMPEFTLVMPSGATFDYMERMSQPQPPITIVYLKLIVPRVDLTNFLTLSGLNGQLLPVPAGAFRQRTVSLPGLDVRSGLNWAADMRHAEKWDPGKGNAPLLMGVINTSAKSSPSDQVFLLVLVDDSTNPQAKVYLQYTRGPKVR